MPIIQLIHIFKIINHEKNIFHLVYAKITPIKSQKTPIRSNFIISDKIKFF